MGTENLRQSVIMTVTVTSYIHVIRTTALTHFHLHVCGETVPHDSTNSARNMAFQEAAPVSGWAPHMSSTWYPPADIELFILYSKIKSTHKLSAVCFVRKPQHAV